MHFNCVHLPKTCKCLITSETMSQSGLGELNNFTTKSAVLFSQKWINTSYIFEIIKG